MASNNLPDIKSFVFNRNSNKFINEGSEICEHCDGTGIDVDFYINYIKDCIKNKTRKLEDWPEGLVELVNLDHSVARIKLVDTLKDIDDESKQSWLDFFRCPKCKGTGEIDWVTKCMMGGK